jgi:hypothetical protein
VVSDITIGNVRVGDVVGGNTIVTGDSCNLVIEYRDDRTKKKKEVLSCEQALGRIADAVRLNLGQVQLNIEAGP